MDDQRHGGDRLSGGLGAKRQGPGSTWEPGRSQRVRDGYLGVRAKDDGPRGGIEPLRDDPFAIQARDGVEGQVPGPATLGGQAEAVVAESGVFRLSDEGALGERVIRAARPVAGAGQHQRRRSLGAPTPAEMDALRATEPDGAEVRRVGHAGESRSTTDRPGSGPGCQRGVAADSRGWRMRVEGVLRRDRVKPMTVERTGLSTIETGARRIGQRVGGSEDLDLATFRNGPGEP